MTDTATLNHARYCVCIPEMGNNYLFNSLLPSHVFIQFPFSFTFSRARFLVWGPTHNAAATCCSCSSWMRRRILYLDAMSTMPCFVEEFVAPLFRSDPIGWFEPDPGCTNTTISLHQKHVEALHFSWHKSPFKYAEAFLKG